MTDIPSDTPYDVNFVFPVTVLKSDRVTLTPFIPSVHFEAFHAGVEAYPDVFKYMSIGPFPTRASLLDGYVAFMQADPGRALFAILDTSRPGAPLVGAASLMNATVAHAAAEIGYIVVFPPFQRTHVTSHMAGLFLHRLLDAPADGGLGLRRAVWQCHSENVPSARAAKRLGFQEEGCKRWEYVLAEGKPGNGVQARDGKGPGRNTLIFSICWDDWEGGTREHIDALMRRTS